MDGRLRRLVDASEAIVFFGGAGVSCESGIGFPQHGRAVSPGIPLAAGGNSVPRFFERRPEEFFRFYRDKMLYPQAEPNAAHLALARLEQAGKLKAVVTQNIDGLHQAAGSKNVLELHGSVHRNHCTRCGAFYTLDDVLRSEGVPRCGCGGVIKPDVVLYGEALDETTLNAAVRAIRRADLLLVGGTSLNVYPAAGLLRYFTGAALAVVNKTPTPADARADLVIQASIGRVLGGFED
ncbi:MAG: NAD-dependent protein deacylase [Ruthenibacterium lactatiformans]|uniref:NAD-dependent protein deacylase n=1 Tax=Ruthenibacterium lactatiformans TaxID=1550024 RepID=UPI003994B086